MTPFQALYGVALPSIGRYLPGTSAVPAVDTALQSRDSLLQFLKFHMSQAQQHMKAQADKHRTHSQFQVGDFVFLRLHPYRQSSVMKRPHHKLSPRYFGHFRVLERIGNDSYKLSLPPSSKIHLVFHVSLLKL